MHLWTGLTVGVVALLVGLTGSAIVFSGELDSVALGPLNRSVDPQLRVSLDDLANQASVLAGGQPLGLVMLPNGSFRTLRFRFGDVTVYADPGTGEILGTATDARGWLWYLRQFHYNFLGGSTGLLVNGICAGLLCLMCLTGIYLWWPRKVFLPDGRRWDWSVHNTAGIWSAVGLLLLALTGMYSVWPVPVMNAIHAVTRTTMPPFTPDSAEGAVSLDRTLRAAQAALPDGTPTLLRLPLQQRKAVSVQMRLPGEWREGGASPVYLERGSARVLRIDRFRDMPLGYRIYSSFGPLHFGQFGIAWGCAAALSVKLLWLVLGLTPTLLLVTGFRMWWNKVQRAASGNS